MKRRIGFIVLLTLATLPSPAQGLVNFLNSPATLITWSSNNLSLGTMPAPLPVFYFELFTAPAGTLEPSQFVSTGLLATNRVGGRIVGGISVAGMGLPMGGTAAILVRGWSANLGETWAVALSNHWAWYGIYHDWIGESAIAPFFLTGGHNGIFIVPASPVFGGSTGIPGGFNLNGPIWIPEPSSAALVGLALASLWCAHRGRFLREQGRIGRFHQPLSPAPAAPCVSDNSALSNECRSTLIRCTLLMEWLVLSVPGQARGCSGRQLGHVGLPG